MAWTSADQNPSLAPAPGLSSPSYAAALQQAAQYGAPGGGSSSTGMAPAAQASSGGSYAERLNATAGGAAPAQPQSTRRALEWSSGQQPATASRAAREIQPWGGGGTRFEIAGKAAKPGNARNANAALVDIVRKAAEGSPYNVQLFSSYRGGSPRSHGRGNAVDIALVDPYSGSPLANSKSSETFPQYEAFARRAHEIAQRDYPDLAGNFRWGGYFSGGRDKYGAVDLMHFDVNSGVGMAGGSWESGLTEDQRRIVDRLGSGKVYWAGGQPAVTYEGDPFGVSGAREQAAMAGGANPPAPRLRPERPAGAAYAPTPETMDQAPFDAVMAPRDRLQAAAPAPAGGGYVVRRGDNLSKIARRELGDANRWREIAAANNLRNPNRLQPGQRLVIPGGQASASSPRPAAQPRREGGRPRPQPPTPTLRPEGRWVSGAGGAPDADSVPNPPMRGVPNAPPRTGDMSAAMGNAPPSAPFAPRATRETWNSMGLGSRGNEYTQLSIDGPPRAPGPRGNAAAVNRAAKGDFEGRRPPSRTGDMSATMGNAPPPAPRSPPRATRETWNSMGLGSRGNEYTQLSIDRPPQRRPADAPPPPGPYDDQSRQYDTPGNVTMANERMGVFEGTPAPENWRPRPNFSASNPSTRVPPRWSPAMNFPPPPVPAGPGMDTSGLIRPPSADERALQTGARPRLPTGAQPMDPRNAAQMDRADGVFRPLAVPGGPPWVASNGIRFYAVR